jgi:type II secretory pathway pseudopilin PulG
VIELMLKTKIKPETGFTVVEIMIVVVMILFLAAIIPSGVVWNRPTSSQEEACVNNLRLIDAAKRQWALEQHKKITDTPQPTDIQPYLGHGLAGELPTCPADSNANPTFTTSYDVRSVGAKPVCRQVPEIHVLPRYELIYGVRHYHGPIFIPFLVTLELVLGIILWRQRSQKNPSGQGSSQGVKP